jgi:hypothetical protein
VPDPHWSDQFHLGLGTYGAWLFAAEVYDGDLVVGGIIGFKDPAGRIGLARWDGVAWQPFAEGLSSGEHSAWPLAMVAYHGDLVVCGDFTHACGQPAAHIARWDGEAWHPLGAGLNDIATALLVYDGGLIALGEFSEAGQTAANGIARWDGEEWHALGEGLIGETHSGWLWADLVEYQGDLVACGPFTEADGLPVDGLARWDGTSWSSFAAAPPTLASALTVHEGDLIVGGAAEESDACAARWDGDQWHAMASAEPWDVIALVSHNGELFCGGCEGWSPYPYAWVGRWTGETWEDTGIANGTPSEFYMSTVAAMGVYEDAVFAAGMLYQGVYRWAGENWQGIGCGSGLSGGVRAFLVLDGRLIAGGGIGWAGGRPVRGVAAWNGSSWEALGSGIAWPQGSWGDRVMALGDYGGVLVAGGEFSTADGHVADYLARWDGASWAPLSSNPTDALNRDVLALASYGGDLITGGAFTVAGGDSVHYIARWDGAAWHSLGGGTSSRVTALAVYQGDLIAAGGFTRAGAVTCSRIARWDGSEWHRMGGVGGTHYPHVNTLAVYGDDLIVGGGFTYGHLTPASNIARWDGEEWHALGEGSQYEVNALGVYHGQLVAAGSFAFAGCEATHELARWDGIVWRPLTSATSDCSDPLDGWVFALASYGDRLFVGGEIEAAGGWPSFGVASWSEPAGNWPGGRVAPLLQVIYPNPFRSVVRIAYLLPFDARVRVTIHDTAGRRRATLAPGYQREGRHTLEWLGRDDVGRRLASGLYFLHLSSGSTVATGRLLLVR